MKTILQKKSVTIKIIAILFFSISLFIYAQTSLAAPSATGDYVSNVQTLSAALYPSTITWEATVPANTSIKLKVRSADNVSMIGAPDWTSACTTEYSITGNSSASLIGNNCVTDGHAYLQYRAVLSTTDSDSIPTLDSVAFSFVRPTSAQTLISNVYNTTFNTARLQKIEWSETLPANTDLKFQLRTSPDNSTWTDFVGPDGTGSTYFTCNTGTESMPSILTSDNNDQYFQYKAFLSTTDGVNTPTLSDVTITYNDAAPPIITGVTDGETYFTSVTPTTANGTATLNGQPYNSGTAITQNGTYTLIVTNDQNTSTSVTFTLIVSKTVINPTPQKITADYNDGIISVSGTNTEATGATINTNYTLQTGSYQYLIPSGTTITPTSGTMDITALAVSDISQTIQEQNSNSKGAIKIGIPNKNVTFSQDITVTLDISSDYNNKTLTIYSRPDNGETWTNETTCLVTDGQCSFTTDHATQYTANYEVSNSPTPTDVNLDLTATISLVCTDSVTLGTITGTGQSNLTTNEASCNVRTINSSGYQLSWQASTPYLENENGDQIAAYTPQTPDTPEVWSVSSTESEWGGRIKTTSTDPDLTGSEIWDNTDSYSGTWLNVSASPFIIANRITETSQTGSDEVILFGAEIGSNKFQPTGTYDTEVIITATTL